jgi:hypothetical protein
MYNALIFLGFSDDDFRLQNDGNGAYIAKWNSASPQPSVAEIEAANSLWVTENENAIAQKAADKASANAKLKALGLTDAEIEAIK